MAGTSLFSGIWHVLHPKRAHGPRLSDALSSCWGSRRDAKVFYPLDEILLLVLCAVISGADGWTSMALYDKRILSFCVVSVEKHTTESHKEGKSAIELDPPSFVVETPFHRATLFHQATTERPAGLICVEKIGLARRRRLPTFPSLPQWVRIER